MHTFVYISEATKDFSTDDLSALLEAASSLNRMNGITGYLHYETGYFLQYIEGEADALSETVERIERDPRHSIFYRASETNLAQRRFPDWYMKWLDRKEPGEVKSAMAGLAAPLEPMETEEADEALERAFSVYKQIFYDHVFRGLTKLKSTNNELSDMLTMSVHDLRSPIRTISMLIDTYAEDKNPPKEFTDFTNKVNKKLSYVEQIVDSITFHFRGSKEDNVDSVDISDVILEVADSIKLDAPDCDIVVLGDLPVIKGKPLQVWRVFSCLIENGVKYNRADRPRVEISVELEEQHWRFCIQDNGIGIEPKDQQKVFEIFKRLHREAEYPGTGVGLATCRKLVEGWEGRIWVSSAADQGSSFYFTHPVQKSQEIAA